jgi:hypothetical protein
MPQMVMMVIIVIWGFRCNVKIGGQRKILSKVKGAAGLRPAG